LARRNQNFVKDADVVWQHGIFVRAVAEKPDDCGVLALDDAHNASFGAAIEAAPLDPREHVVTVHRVLKIVRRNEEVAFNLGYRFIGHDESVAVAVSHQAAGD